MTSARIVRRLGTRSFSFASTALLLTLVSASCSSDGAGTAQLRAEPKAQEHFGEAAMDIVLGADKVEVYRLEKSLDDPAKLSPEESAKLVAGLARIKTKVADVPDGWGAKFAEEIAQDSSYGWDYAKGCKPMSGVLVRYHRESDVVDVSICFQCEMLSIAKRGEERWEDFDPIKAKIAALVKPLFPDDAAIQKL